MDMPSPVPCILLTVEVLSGKLFKNVLLELLTHADAVILDVKFKIGKACRSRILLYNPQADLPTVRRELHGA